MPSPFPGMNPYFESPHFWRGFHNSFLTYLRAYLTTLVAPRYFIDYEESLFIDPDDEDALPRRRKFAVADVGVSTPGRPRGAVAARKGRGAVVGTIPMTEPVRHKRRWLHVLDGRTRAVVTVIELLSPSDKRPGKDRNRYLVKRRKLLKSRTHLVELDLLRGGRRLPVEGLPECDYFCAVSRWAERPRCELYPFRLADPLPELPLPLLPGDDEPVFALKPVLDRTYDEGGYAHQLYGEPLDPPLAPEQAAWAADLLSAAEGRRHA